MPFRPPLLPLLRSARPLHGAKNLLLFVPLLAGHCTDRLTWFNTALAVVAFSLAAGAGYLINDVKDVHSDRAHPRKAKRPVAAGHLAPRVALGGAGFLLGGALVLALQLPRDFALALLAYPLLSLLYSLCLRRVAGLDLLAIAAFFVLRVVAGGAASGIWPSAWLLAFVGAVALALAGCKRHAELTRLHGEGPGPDAQTQAPGRGWWTHHRTLLLGIAAAASLAAVGVLAAYTQSLAASLLYAHPPRLLLLPALLALWLGRLIHLTRQGKMSEDPLIFALTDWGAWLLGILMAAAAVWAAA